MTATEETMSKRYELESEVAALEAERRSLATELGLRLFESAKGNAELREGHEGFFDGIDAVGEKIKALQAQVEGLDAAEKREQLREKPVNCPRCGREIRVDDSFCSGCGIPADQGREEALQQMANALTLVMPPLSPTCPQCGAVVSGDDLFCSGCGAPLNGEGLIFARREQSDLSGVDVYLDARCPSCGAIVAKDDAFCMGCGANLGMERRL